VNEKVIAIAIVGKAKTLLRVEERNCRSTAITNASARVYVAVVTTVVVALATLDPFTWRALTWRTLVVIPFALGAVVFATRRTRTLAPLTALGSVATRALVAVETFATLGALGAVETFATLATVKTFATFWALTTIETFATLRSVAALFAVSMLCAGALGGALELLD
jgi:hypothetical protein